VFRQAAASRIIVNAHRINRGEMPETPKAGENSDFFMVEIATPEEGVPKVIEMIRDRIPRRFGLNPIKDVQVLSPMIRGDLGARNLHLELQAVLNPNPPTSVERFGWKFAPGDRIMETVNDYDRDVGYDCRSSQDDGVKAGSKAHPSPASPGPAADSVRLAE
jgi:exodeoxyribonuclease V alpha subunit